MNGQVSGFAPYKDVVFSNKGITCAEMVCLGTRKDNGKGIVWGNNGNPQALTAHTAHDPHAPALPPSSGILPPCRRFSLSKGLVCCCFSLCASASLFRFPTSIAHGVACMVGSPPTSGVIGCVFGREGVRGRERGQGRGAVSCLPPSPALWVSIPYMCVPTASITSWDRGHAMCVLPRPCPACMEKQAYFCGV